VTNEELDEIERRAQAATPGPWFATNTRNSRRDGSLSEHEYGKRPHTVSTDPEEAGWEHDGGCDGYGISEVNARFIAHARTDIPALIAAVRERDVRIAKLEAERDGLRAALEVKP
jgi:hypothetical protein